MAFLLAFANAVTLFGAPADHDALEAIQRRFAGVASERAFAMSPADGEGQPGFPISVSVLRCEAKDAPNVGSGSLSSAQLCVLDILPWARPAYRVSGAFYHDGLQWTYYGPLSAGLIEPYENLPGGQTSSVVSPKPGAIEYMGMPTGLKDRDPNALYRDIIDGHDWWLP